MPSRSFYLLMARSMLAGSPEEDDLVARLSRMLGRDWRWIRGLVRRYRKQFGADGRPRRKEVVAFLRADDGFGSALQRYRKEIQIAEWMLVPNCMRPVQAAAEWPVPAIETVGTLADWLHATPAELLWFADPKRLCAGRGSSTFESPLNHYHYRVLAKQGGSVRLIEAPKLRLKWMQQQILSEILEKIPGHPSVHGFVKGRSIKTFVAPHVSRRVVLRMDLRDFFPSISGARVQALFRTMGYPEPVADLLGRLCTNAAPRDLWRSLAKGIDPLSMADARALYAWPHLPQGAPTSPALANLCAYRVDCRLRGLANAARALYTRYADDLAFSGDASFERSAEPFSIRAAAILLEEGFRVHHRKTRMMRHSVRQHLAGLVLNTHANIDRRDFDRLKAILTNCIRSGPESQNRDAHPAFQQHLQGRVAFVEMVNPPRGAKLRSLFDRIDWRQPSIPHSNRNAG